MAMEGVQSGNARSRAAVHLLIPTHTTRHLGACIAGLSWQTTPPATVVVTCDTDEPAIARLLDEVWPSVHEQLCEPRPRLFHVGRPHQGEPRLNQVRNNGLRALDDAGLLRDEDQVVVLDGDTLLHPEAIARHGEMARKGFELVIPYRVNLSEEESTRIDGSSVLADRGRSVPSWLDPDSHRELARRDARYNRHLLFRRLRIAKRHKAKVLGGHHAVSVRVLRAVNGYDEGYVGYGYDDDDLSRRIHELRPRVRVGIAVEKIPAFHLWHPTRAPARPTEAPGYERFRLGGPTVVEHGWRGPMPQATPTVREVAAGEALELRP